MSDFWQDIAAMTLVFAAVIIVLRRLWRWGRGRLGCGCSGCGVRPKAETKPLISIDVTDDESPQESE